MPGTRKAVYAGSFYPSGRDELTQMLEDLVPGERERAICAAAICPHAGYIYSGRTAGETYGRCAIPEAAIILGPNHTGRGARYALSGADYWETPLGRTPVNKDIVGDLLSNPLFELDDRPHETEHSIEVQIPFLQFLREDISIVPICLNNSAGNPDWSSAGEAIAGIIKRYPEQIIVVASTDLTHYESESEAREKDRYAIEAILQMDADKLLQGVVRQGISMCGYGPVITTIHLCRKLGKKKCRLVHYSTSGETSGDFKRVVGYGGIIID